MIYTPATTMSCSACGSEVSSAARFCPSCGSSLALSATPTVSITPSLPRQTPVSEVTVKKSSPKSASHSSSDSMDARFVPGTTLVGRYRVVALLGKGGMGEVYRADDLKLGQPVALKFLPEGLQQDGTALARFHREVRLARQVSHPNVCRVFDIGEAEGRTFLTMEYVDGEDLASLLRRIGRLPADKGLEIARQLCAGLAAAHEHGVVHRDLKPANAMLDGRGRVRITDFGLAGFSGEDGGRAGTPAYMAPEQLSGDEVTPKSDIYSLGLMLYEIFTGKRAFEATTFADMMRRREQSAPTHPSHIVKDIDPLVERVILRCLEKDPAKRPATALQLAAALPGGDPLAAALAAGETPSPEMVAAAGDEGALAPRTAWIFLVGTFVVLALVVALAPKASDLGLKPLSKTPDALTDRARELVRQFGYGDEPADSDSGFLRAYDFLRYRALNDPSSQRVRGLASAELGPMNFWYRQSPGPMVPTESPDVSPSDPAMTVPGMVSVTLSSSGKLIKFHAVPPEVEDPKGPSADPDWGALFAAAGLDMKRFTLSGPKLLPPVPFDARAEWDGSSAQDPATLLHVTAAAYRGKPVYFDVFGPWNLPTTAQHSTEVFATASIIGGVTFSLTLVSLLVAGAIFARRNVRMGRGDRKGSFQVAAFVFSSVMLGWILGGHHVWDLGGEFRKFIITFCVAVGGAIFVWVNYMALEPYVRRHWPDVLISWTRLLSGKVWDPLVGRDVLAGALLGTTAALSAYALDALPYWFNVPGLTPIVTMDYSLGGPNRVLSVGLNDLLLAVLFALITLSLLFLARVFLRKQWLAVAVTGTMLTVLQLAITGENFWVALPFTAVIVALSLIVLIRFGLLALFVFTLYQLALDTLPVTLDFHRWYIGRSLFLLVLLIGFAVCGFRAALAGRPVFGNLAFED
jgi:serine/threonine protein kinase